MNNYILKWITCPLKKNAFLSTIPILFLILVGCTETKMNRSVSYGSSFHFRSIIINNSRIKNKPYSDEYIDSLKKDFSILCNNVSIISFDKKAKVGELVVYPTALSVSHSKLKLGHNVHATLSASVEILSLEFSNTFNTLTNVEGKTPGAAVAGQLLLAPLFLFPVGDDKNTSTIISKKYAINQVIEKSTHELLGEITSSTFFKEANERAKISLTSEASLIVKVVFDEKNSFFQNHIIDAGENSSILTMVTNNGKGTAFNVYAQIETIFKNIIIPEEINIGDIQPGEKKIIEIPISADINLKTGTASFLVNVLEKRGYNARPVKLQVATAAIQKPELGIASCNLNDTSGLGVGDGDSRPENNETIELSPYIQNSGVGNALDVDIFLKDVTPGIEIVKNSDKINLLEPGSRSKATLAFKIPRTFSGSEITYSVVAKDVRGLTTSKTYSHPFVSSAPQLDYSYRITDDQNHEISSLENGNSYKIKLTPKNKGNNIAKGVTMKVSPPSGKVQIGNYPGKVGIIAQSGSGETIIIPVSLARSYTGKVIDLNVQMNQDSFPGLDQNITLPVRVTQPKLDYHVVLLNGESETSFTENFQPKFRVSISNNGHLGAQDVRVLFQSLDRNNLINENQVIGTINTGESQYKDFTFRVPGGVNLGEFPIKVVISQSDFDTREKISTFKIIKQTAIVQKVQGTKSNGASAKAVYSGPPEVYINSPNNNVEVFKKTINLHGSVILFGSGNDLVDFKILINGNPLKVLTVTENMKLGPDIITKRKIEGNKVVFDGEVNLDPEVNEIVITSRDRNSLETRQTIKVNKKAKLGDIYAVVVGISQYKNQSYNLGYAASDARKFYDFLKSEKGGSLPENRIKLLTDYQATRAGIIEALTRFTGRASKEDTVEIYLATHGVTADDGELYYLAYNTEIDNLFGTAFSNTDLEKIIKDKIRADRVIIYLDACHSGMAGLSQTMYAKRDIGVIDVNRKIDALATQLSKTAAGVVTLSASSSTGYSLEDKDWDGGVFTYSLLKGLYGEANANDDEWVSLDEIDNYLTREVFTLTDGKQKPKVNGTLIGETTVLSKVK